MSNCAAEMCRHWTGHGCACDVLDIEPDECDGCGREIRGVELCDDCRRWEGMTAAERAHELRMMDEHAAGASGL